MRQFVGCGPAKLEELADFLDADQPVAAPLGLPGSFRPGDCRVWRAAHGLPLAPGGSADSMIVSSVTLPSACLCLALDGLRPVPPFAAPPQPRNSRIDWTATWYLASTGTMREYLVSLAMVPELGVLRGTIAAAGGKYSRPEPPIWTIPGCWVSALVTAHSGRSVRLLPLVEPLTQPGPIPVPTGWFRRARSLGPADPPGWSRASAGQRYSCSVQRSRKRWTA